ncbi:MAG: fasciclin domain-containing protein [Planctomycetota bacterium]
MSNRFATIILSGYSVIHNSKYLPLMVVSLLVLGGEQACRAETPEEASTIGRKLGSIEKASTFVKLLKDTDAAKNLLFSSNGTTTVFVPTNKAFEKLSKERLQALIDPANKQYLERVLTYHAAHNTRIDRYVLRRIGFLLSGLGQYLKINPDRTGDVITVDGATIEEYDLACSNGVVHFIDTVLDPIELDLFEYLEKDGRFTILTKLIKRSGQTKLFQNRHDVYTVFAPTDEAFASLPKGTVDSLLLPEKLDLLSDVIKTHIALGTWTVAKIPDVPPLGTPGIDVANQYGQELVYRTANGRGTIENIAISTADLVTRNGFVHVIDRPLLPKRDSIITALERNGGFGEFLNLARDAGIYDVLGQFQLQVTVFAPTDAALKSDALKERLKMLKDPANRERLRAVLLRHVVFGRILTTNSIDFLRFNSQINARIDLVREGAKRTIQGVQIVETDILARNGVAHGINGIIDEAMEAPDTDQTWQSFVGYVKDTIRSGNELYTAGKYSQASDYYARRGYELKARFAANITRFYGINVQIILNNDVYRNRDYDFASTAWSQRNKFLELQRTLETKTPLQIDEIELRIPAKKQ